MKRSEAINLMVAFYKGTFKRFGYEICEKDLMDGLLMQLEKVGMLPPAINLNEGSSQYGIPSNYVNEWEPEDEK